MKTIIVKGLNEQESDEMRQAFAHASYLRKRIIKLLQEKVDASNRTVRSKDAYGISNWAYLQADAVGYERAMQEVISMLTHEAEGAVRDPEESVASSGIPLEKPRRGRPRKNIL